MNKGMRKSNAFDIPYTAQQNLPMQLGPAGSLTYMLTRRGSPQSPIDDFILCWNCSCSGAIMCHLSCNCFMVEVALLNSRGIGMGILYGFQESPKNCKNILSVYPHAAHSEESSAPATAFLAGPKSFSKWNDQTRKDWYDVIWWCDWWILMEYARFNSILI